MQLDLVDIIIGALFSLGMMAFKPEWFADLIANLIRKKFGKRQANKMTNVLGLKFLWIGVDLIEDMPDDPAVSELVEEIKSNLKLLGTRLTYHAFLTSSDRRYVDKVSRAAFYGDEKAREQLREKILKAAQKALNDIEVGVDEPGRKS